MAFSILFSFLVLVIGAVAQLGSRDVSRPYLDSKTGIEFQGLVHSAGLRAGFVLPKNASTDVIIQLLAPLSNGEGWVGLSLGGGMTEHLLVVAWGSGGKVLSTFRKASEYLTPPVWNGTATMIPIKSGTYVNSTYLSYTFLCKKCVTNDALTFNFADEITGFGWAISTTPVDTPNDPASQLNFHAGYGLFNQNLTETKSGKYLTYAALAG